MSKQLKPIRGMKDLLMDEYQQFYGIVSKVREVCSTFNFKEVATPIVEYTDVFSRTLGETSDVVNKEMYSFEDRSGEGITLRPEFTAGIARAFISNGMQQHLPLKLFSTGPLFRYERPQKGRQRQFHQVNCEYLGVAEPYADAEMLALAASIFEALGVDISIEVNTLGDADSRKAYVVALKEFLNDHVKNLSEDSQRRLETNPLRILDSKDEVDKTILESAPDMQDYLNDASQAFFGEVLERFKAYEFKESLTPKINARLVRGLDYYCHTVFECVASGGDIGAQSTVLAGGRYDGLISQMGGPQTPAIGFAAGVERLMLVSNLQSEAVKPVVILPLTNEEEAHSVRIASELRKNGFSCEVLVGAGMKKGLKKADKMQASHAVIIGPDEREREVAVIKNLQSGSQQESAISAVIKELIK